MRDCKVSGALEQMVSNEFNYNLFENKCQSYVISYISRQNTCLSIYKDNLKRSLS